jgi:hypothetical protein
MYSLKIVEIFRIINLIPLLAVASLIINWYYLDRCFVKEGVRHEIIRKVLG